jgi:hypothetical protein
MHHLSTNFISDDLFETVNRTGVDEPIIKSICQDLFRLNSLTDFFFASKKINFSTNFCPLSP